MLNKHEDPFFITIGKLNYLAIGLIEDLFRSQCYVLKFRVLDSGYAKKVFNNFIRTLYEIYLWFQL